ncbi:MAG: formate dehydrogenase accessory sulfurtransferase FdhD [Chitinophagales bacterium]|nr:formate dehydrogenase accessory sulfurtransferase FdhD [Chitinophagales bacterium]
MPGPTSQLKITKNEKGQFLMAEDMVVVEEPLEIKLLTGPLTNRESRSLAVTMRTPGQDNELAAGFLFTEGLIGKQDDIIAIQHVGQALHPDAKDNIIQVELSPELQLDFDKLSRHFYTSSSCGVCGKTSIEMVRSTSCYYPRKQHPVISSSFLYSLPPMLRPTQSIFEFTGGIHAAALFNTKGELLLIREDVGRHNALDKLLGAALMQGMLPLREHIVLLSGRAGFELVQKALMAGVPILAAVGAPSSLAVELADDYGMTLVGFLRGERFNVYCGQERIKNI